MRIDLLTSILLVFGMLPTLDYSQDTTGDQQFTAGDFWRHHVLIDLMPNWYNNGWDKEQSVFYLHLSSEWEPLPPYDRMPAMISRQIFSFSTAYLLSGEEKYLEIARKATKYLLSYGWDLLYGGWFGNLSPEGDPTDSNKGAASQLYTNVGLVQFYYATGDKRVLEFVLKSVEIQKKYTLDAEFDGYYITLNRDLSVRDSSKAKHSHYGQGSLMPNLILATFDSSIMALSKRFADLSIEHMIDSTDGWVLGYPAGCDRRWHPVPYIVDGKEHVYLGASLTAALFFMRLYFLTGEEKYRIHGEAIGEKLCKYGWNKERGQWYTTVEKELPCRPNDAQSIQWWIQIYGALLQLHLYHITGEKRYLDNFRKTESFYHRYFLDQEYGGVFSSVMADGSWTGEGEKAGPWHTSYHEIEHGFLNYLYLNLYVNLKPVVLHFRLDGPAKHFVSPVDDPDVKILGVTIDGNTWTHFDPRTHQISLPPGENMHVQVMIGP